MNCRNEVTTIQKKKLDLLIISLFFAILLTRTRYSNVDQDQASQYQWLESLSFQHSQASNHLGSDRDHECKLLYVVYGSYHEYHDGFSCGEVYYAW